MRRRYYLPERNRQEGPRGPPGRDGTSGGGNTPANPSALIGATATNGTATTYMRSDAAPALETTGVTSGFYKSADITVDAQGRVTAASDGSAITTFRLAGDSGSQQDIVNNSVMTVGGGVGLTSTAATPETVTLDLEDTAVTPGSYKSADITVDQQGRITAASAGAQGTMSSFTVTGDNASTQTIEDGDTLTVRGGTGISTEVFGLPADTIEIDLADTAVTPGTYEHANITVDQQGRITAATDGPVDEVLVPCKNDTIGTISKGTPIYITGTVGASDTFTIAAADASNSATMPASGVLQTTLTPNTQGFYVQTGLLRGFNTSGITGSPGINDTVYVSNGGGGLTATKPTGTNLIQNIGIVARLDATNGSILVSSVLRSNDVPNIPEGQAWIGDASGVATPTDVAFTMDGDTGTTQTVNNGDLLTISGGSGLGLTLEAEASSVGGNPRCTIVPASGTLGQQYGGTGIDFTTATNGQLLMGVTSAAASLGSIASANANIVVSFKSGTPNEITLTAKAAEISSTSGYYQVWYDSTNGLFKYFNSKGV